MNGLSISGELQQILRRSRALKSAYLVGGCVRDALLGIPHKDYDVEVYGVDMTTLEAALAKWGSVNRVGRSFGVLKLSTASGLEVDFSLPRRDSKVAEGHRGFAVEFGAMEPREAAARRDFTINALMFHFGTSTLLDFFGGQADLENKVLRHVGGAFSDDPLRVLRGMQLCSRFDLVADPETVSLCRSIRGRMTELAPERIWTEWAKWAEKGGRPSAGLKFLHASGWMENFPELSTLVGTPQDPEWHPEGDVFTHTCHCCDALVRLPAWQAADVTGRLVYSFAVLTHDFGKPRTTHRAIQRGRERVVSPGHESVGGPLADSFLHRIRAPNLVRERVVPLVVNHMAHFHPATPRAVRRLARRLHPENIHGLCVVMSADQLGRPPKPPIISSTVRELETLARALEVAHQPPKPLLLGRHLVELGMEPGVALGQVVHAAYEAQIEGRFDTLAAAQHWLLKESTLHLPPPLRDRLEKIVHDASLENDEPSCRPPANGTGDGSCASPPGRSA